MSVSFRRLTDHLRAWLVSGGIGEAMWAGRRRVRDRLVAISFAAGGAWLIVAVPLALVLLIPAAIAAYRRRVAGDTGLRGEQGKATPAVRRRTR